MRLQTSTSRTGTLVLTTIDGECIRWNGFLLLRSLNKTQYSELLVNAGLSMLRG